MSDPRIVMRGVAELIPYARNSRVHSDAQVAQIAASIKEFGFTNPVLVDGDGGIIAGHGRIMAARKLGIERVPTICLDHLSETQKRAYIIADNQLALNSSYDEELLSLEIIELNDDGFDLKLLGFEPDDIDKYLDFDPNAETGGEGEGEGEGTGQKEPTDELVFKLTPDQLEQVREALKLSRKSSGYTNDNDALIGICEVFTLAVKGKSVVDEDVF